MMCRYILDEGLVDQRFVESRTEGFAEFERSLKALDLDELERIHGVPREQVREAALCYARASAAMSFHGLGVTEHRQGTFTVMQIADLAMITGNIGRRGVGVNPLRGQNNVQGLADMGVQPHQGAGYLDVTLPEVHAHYESFYGARLSREVGLKIPEMYDAALAGTFKALWVMGEDLVQTDPNTNKVNAALKALDLLVVQELFMTDTARAATVVLPAASFLEKTGTFTNAERRVQRVQQVIPPLPGTKTDGQIVVDIMQAMGYAQPDYDPKAVLEEIAQIVPFMAGATWEGLGDNGVQWPFGPDGKGTAVLHTEQFKLGKGRLAFKGFEESPELLENARDFPFILTTNRDLEHYNCGTMTRRTANAAIHQEDVLWINPADAAAKGIAEGDWVCVSSARGKIDVRAMITDGVKPGVLSTTFHFPELMINVLTSSVHDTEAKCPEYKVVAVDIRKSRKLQERRGINAGKVTALRK